MKLLLQIPTANSQVGERAVVDLRNRRARFRPIPAVDRLPSMCARRCICARSDRSAGPREPACSAIMCVASNEDFSPI